MSGFDKAVCTCGTATPFHGLGCDKARALLATHGVTVEMGSTTTPAAMLGEARELLRRAESVLGRLREVRADAPHLLVMADEAASNAASWVEDLIVMEREREAEAREVQSKEQRAAFLLQPVGTPAGPRSTGFYDPKAPDSCWQCDRPLGTGPDACLTCAARRAEDRAKETGAEGRSCATCGREFTTPSSRDAHQATAHGERQG